MPFYVSPEQLMKDRADYARKGIARGRSVVVAAATPTASLFVAENPSRALHKVSEIYDRIAFAAVGKYNEFENLRVAGRPARRPARLLLRPPRRHRPRPGQRLRPDARARSSPSEQKPYEVEIVVAEVGDAAADDQIYRLTYDGSVADEHGFVGDGRPGRGRSAGVLRGALRRRHDAAGRPYASRSARSAEHGAAEARRPSGRASSRSPSSTAPGPAGASSGGSPTPRSAQLLAG